MNLYQKIAVAVKNALIAENNDASVYINAERNDVWITTHPVWSDPATRDDWDNLGSVEGYFLDGYSVEELTCRFDADDAPEHWIDWARESVEQFDENND